MSPTSTPSTKIDYNDANGRFVFTVQQWDIGRVRGLPNRRWDARRKTWSAPAIRANVEYMAAIYQSNVEYSPLAAAKLKEAQIKRTHMHRPSAFPAWYKFKREPRKAQRAALDATYGLEASGLIMDMRTGKTKVVIDTACAYRMEGKISSVVLICPLGLRKNWVREFAKDATIDIDYHLLDTSDKGKAFEKWLHKPHDFKWLLVGVESLAAGSAIQYVERFTLAKGPIYCPIDESSKIKNHAAERSKRVVSLRKTTKYRQLMTGTPIAKGPMDLFMPFEFLDPDIIGLGDFYSFRNRYAVMGGYEDREIIGYNNMDELMELLAPFVYQVRQSDVIDVADKVRVLREVELSPDQKKFYRQMRRDKRVDSACGDKSLITQNVLEQMLRLQEISGGLISYAYTPEQIDNMKERGIRKPEKFWREKIPGPNPKLNELLACCEEYEGQTIVWCAYKEEIYMVTEALRDKYGVSQVVDLHGDVDEAQRDINVYELFQKKKARFIIGNAATGGMGLTMDIAENEFYFSNTFNFIDRLQSEERATAEGKVGVIIVDIVTRGTVDNTILAALAEKKNVSDYVRQSIDDKRAAIAAMLGDLDLT